MRSYKKITALLVALMLLFVPFVMTACQESTGTEDKTEYESVSGKCYVFAGMSADDEEYDEELLKEMFRIQDLSEYLTIKFEEDGTAKVAFLLYGDKAVLGKWTEKNGQINIDLGKLDNMNLTMDENGILSTVYAEDDDEFLITLQKTEDIPDTVAEDAETVDPEKEAVVDEPEDGDMEDLIID